MKVAIVGRPNVGKSSLFNRIVGHNKAIVEPSCGVTRDRLVCEVRKQDHTFSLVDTGGFDPSQKDRISQLVSEQVRQAVNEAAVIILVGDAMAGLTDLDKKVVQLVRKSGKPAILAVNKTDSGKLELSAGEFYSLGIEPLICVSAAQGRGIEELINKVIEFLPGPAPQGKEAATKIAVVGRPNVGKSSFVNKLLNEERVIVDSSPGTTRDAIDTEFFLDGLRYTLIDTAGIRRRSKIKSDIDRYGAIRTEQAIERCDVVLVMIDADSGLTVDDIRVMGLVLQKSKGCVLVLNKWDLVQDISPGDYEKNLRARMRFIKYIPFVSVSALTGQRVSNAVQIAAEVEKNTRFQITTSILNEFWGRLCERHQPSAVKGKKPKIHYFTQTGIKPPTFLAFSNYPGLIRKNYTHFLESSLREEFGLVGTPIKINYRLKR